MKHYRTVESLSSDALWEEYAKTFNRIAKSMEKCNVNICELHRLIELACRMDKEYAPNPK